MSALFIILVYVLMREKHKTIPTSDVYAYIKKVWKFIHPEKIKPDLAYFEIMNIWKEGHRELANLNKPNKWKTFVHDLDISHIKMTFGLRIIKKDILIPNTAFNEIAEMCNELRLGPLIGIL